MSCRSKTAPDTTSALSYSKPELVPMHCAPQAPPIRFGGTGSPISSTSRIPAQILHLAALMLTHRMSCGGLSRSRLLGNDLEALCAQPGDRDSCKQSGYTSCQDTALMLLYRTSCTTCAANEVIIGALEGIMPSIPT